jgi:hypothetical protein
MEIKLASQKQIAYINTLIQHEIERWNPENLRQADNDAEREVLAKIAKNRAIMQRLIIPADITTLEAGDLIDALKAGNFSSEFEFLHTGVFQRLRDTLATSESTETVETSEPLLMSSQEKAAKLVYEAALQEAATNGFFLMFDPEDIIEQSIMDVDRILLNHQLVWVNKDPLYATYIGVIMRAAVLNDARPANFGVREAARRAEVSIRYVQAEIKAGRLLAELVKPPQGRSFYTITEKDYSAWVSNPQRGQRGGRSQKKSE